MALMAGTLHVVEYNALVYRRIWRGSIAVSFFTPLFFLAAMGLGLGGLVNRSSGGVNGVPYLDFLAPGLIAAACMQTAAVEAMYPILAKIMWDKTYEAALATPVTISDLIRGEVIWITIRMFIVATMFWIVMYLFGVGRSLEALLAIPASILDAHHRFQREAPERQRLRGHQPVRDHPALPARRDLLSDRQAAAGAAGGGVDDPARARRGPDARRGARKHQCP